jgi:hypothetical protein
MPHGEYIYCELSDGTIGGFPAWMADATKVNCVAEGAPLASAAALIELHALLGSLHPVANCGIAAQKEGRPVDSKAARIRRGLGADESATRT